MALLASSRSARTRAGTLFAAAMTAAALAVAPGTAAAATPGPSSAFLAAQLAANGNHLTSSYDGQTFVDYGLTADAVFALAAEDSAQDAAQQATDFLAAHVDDYLGTAGDTYAGATGKLLTLAVVQGENPRDFGGQDLVSRLQGTMADTGRFADVSAWGDYSNTIGQSWALIGLQRSGDAPHAEAVSFLRGQQCADGGFRIELDAADCVSDTDATSFAIQALVAVAGAGDADVAEAATWLAGKSRNGGFGGAGPTAALNANSTGVAAAALSAAGKTADAVAARNFLAGLQFDCTAPEALRGAYAYKFSGTSATAADSEILRATTQAAVGASGQNYATVSATGDAAAPAAFDCTTAPAGSLDGVLGSLGSSDGAGSLGSLTASIG